jgi:hydroxyacylglutathione hydrolase
VLEESIKTKLFTLPEDVIVYPGHGESTTIGDEMKSNPFVKMI